MLVASNGSDRHGSYPFRVVRSAGDGVYATSIDTNFPVFSQFAISATMCAVASNASSLKLGHVDHGLYLEGWPPGKIVRCEPPST